MRSGFNEQLRGEYSAQRLRNEGETQRREAEAIAADPYIGELLDLRRGLFIDAMRRAIAIPAQTGAAMSTGQARAHAIGEEIGARLTSAGLSADYLEPTYRCAVCKDTGYVGEPLRNRCECYKKRLFELTLAASGLNERDTHGFDNFDASCLPDEIPEGARLSQRELTQRVCQLMRDYAESFPNTETLNILLTGASGLGKTFLMDCAAGRVVERGFMVMKLTAYQMSEAMRAHHSAPVMYYNPSDDSNAPDARFELMMNCDLLCLDDLGIEPMLENLSIPHLYTLINERLAARRHTLIATNLTPHEIAQRYTERVASRLLDTQRAQVIRLIGRDIRLSKRQQNSGIHAAQHK